MDTSSDLILTPFSPIHQLGVDELLLSIAPEYAETFYHIDSKKMKDLYQLKGRYYWVALDGIKVVGTVGVIVTPQFAILKSLFVAKPYRGHSPGIAQKLLKTASNKAIEHNCSIMYLGTMSQFTAAQRFYEKHGYIRIKAEEMPADIPANDFDTVFYKKHLD